MLFGDAPQKTKYPEAAFDEQLGKKTFCVG